MDGLDNLLVESMEDLLEDMEDFDKRLVEDTMLVEASFSTIKTGVEATKLEANIKRADTSMLHKPQYGALLFLQK